MIVRTGAPDNFELSGSIPVRRFTFRVGEGQAEPLLDGPRLATLVKATSSLSILEVDGIRIVLDGPLGGRPGKQLIVQVRQEDSGPKLEVRPRPAAQAVPQELGTVPSKALRELGTVPSKARGELGTLPSEAVRVTAQSQSDLGTVPSKAPNLGMGEMGTVPSEAVRVTAQSRSDLGTVPSKAPVGGQPPGQASSPPAPILQRAGEHPDVIPTHASQPSPNSLPANASGAALAASVISEAVEGNARSTLLGIADTQALPLQRGEALPVQAVLARPQRTVFAVRGVLVEAKTGGFQNSKAYWAEVISGAPNVVIRIQSSLDPATLQAIANYPLASAASATLLSSQSAGQDADVLLPGDFPLKTNLVARVLSPLPSGDFLLEIGGRQLAAPLPQGIQEGEEVLLRIERNPQGVPQVRVVERLSNLIRRSPARLPAADSLGLLSRQLKALLSQGQAPPVLHRLAAKAEAMIGPDAPPTAQRIANLMEQGGLQYESKLAQILSEGRPQSLQPLLHNDLKALLLRAQSEIRLQTDKAEPWRHLAESIDRHLIRIETLQTANLAAQIQSAPLQFEIPFLAGGHLSTVELFIQPDGEGSDSSEKRSAKGFNILFMLDLEGLGRTRVDAHLSGLSLSALISLEQDQALDTLQALLPRLQESLEEAGFRQAQLGVRLLQERQPETDEGQSLFDLQGVAPADINRIDVVA